MEDQKLFKYLLIGGVLLASVIYLPPPVFENFPGGEGGLVIVTPFWLFPIIFAVSGYAGMKLKKPSPKKFATTVSLWSIFVLFWFFIILWPQL